MKQSLKRPASLEKHRLHRMRKSWPERERSVGTGTSLGVEEVACSRNKTACAEGRSDMAVVGHRSSGTVGLGSSRDFTVRPAGGSERFRRLKDLCEPLTELCNKQHHLLCLTEVSTLHSCEGEVGYLDELLTSLQILSSRILHPQKHHSRNFTFCRGYAKWANS